jgi:hypothetical protein
LYRRASDRRHLVAEDPIHVLVREHHPAGGRLDDRDARGHPAEHHLEPHPLGFDLALELRRLLHGPLGGRPRLLLALEQERVLEGRRRAPGELLRELDVLGVVGVAVPRRREHQHACGALPHPERHDQERAQIEVAHGSKLVRARRDGPQVRVGDVRHEERRARPEHGDHGVLQSPLPALHRLHAER